MKNPKNKQIMVDKHFMKMGPQTIKKQQKDLYDQIERQIKPIKKELE